MRTADDFRCRRGRPAGQLLAAAPLLPRVGRRRADRPYDSRGLGAPSVRAGQSIWTGDESQPLSQVRPHAGFR
jgi:hypothetical protein